MNRDVFFCEMGGFDSHFRKLEILTTQGPDFYPLYLLNLCIASPETELSVVLENKLPSLSHAISSFWDESELISCSLWFGRESF